MGTETWRSPLSLGRALAGGDPLEYDIPWPWEPTGTFGGLPTVDVGPARPIPENGSAVAWRFNVHPHPDDHGLTFNSLLDRLLDAVDAASVLALVIGECWTDHDVPTLIAAAHRLVGLRALYLAEPTACGHAFYPGDTDLTAVLSAYPALEVLRVAPTTSTTLQPTHHQGLRELSLEGPRMDAHVPYQVVTALAASELPNLARLELWLGDGLCGDMEIAALAGILDGSRLPALRSLGLRNADITDQIAQAIPHAAVLARLAELDLSLGTLTDVGGEALLTTPSRLAHLRRLDLHHHYLSAEMAAQIVASLPTVNVDVAAPQKPKNRQEPTIAWSDLWP